MKKIFSLILVIAFVFAFIGSASAAVTLEAPSIDSNGVMYLSGKSLSGSTPQASKQITMLTKDGANIKGIDQTTSDANGNFTFTFKPLDVPASGVAPSYTIDINDEGTIVSQTLDSVTGLDYIVGVGRKAQFDDKTNKNISQSGDAAQLNVTPVVGENLDRNYYSFTVNSDESNYLLYFKATSGYTVSKVESFYGILKQDLLIDHNATDMVKKYGNPNASSGTAVANVGGNNPYLFFANNGYYSVSVPVNHDSSTTGGLYNKATKVVIYTTDDGGTTTKKTVVMLNSNDNSGTGSTGLAGTYAASYSYGGTIKDVVINGDDQNLAETPTISKAAASNKIFAYLAPFNYNAIDNDTKVVIKQGGSAIGTQPTRTIVTTGANSEQYSYRSQKWYVYNWNITSVANGTYTIEYSVKGEVVKSCDVTIDN